MEKVRLIGNRRNEFKFRYSFSNKKENENKSLLVGEGQVKKSLSQMAGLECSP